MDRFQNPKPILYMRANVGAPNVIPNYPSGGTADKNQYNPDLWLGPYGFTSSSISTTDFPAKTAANGNIPAGAASYFSSPSLFGAARGQNAYMLISAGADGKFGTKDDLIYP